MNVVVNSQRLLERFLQYVQIDTMADASTDRYPSSPGQIELGKLIAEQLRQMGAADVSHSEFGVVMATIPGNVGDVPTIAFNAHLDTSPETTAADVKPQVIKPYGGGDIPLANGQTITVDQCAALKELVGKTLITTDGTTLLGGDDKAGVAIILELAQLLLENPNIPHPEVRVLLTCDEEIGRGTQHADPADIQAAVCYTFDGGGKDNIDVETFSADGVNITIEGVNIHPAIAKDKMVNAVRVAGELLARMPRELAPERTADRDGFWHPYVIEGGVARLTLQVLLRSFDTGQLAPYADQLRAIAADVEREFPGCRIDLKVSKQYRNLGDGLKREPRAVDYAVEAHRRLGRQPQLASIRGGTDGSQFTEKGLPTPNLSSGQHNIHSPLEFACLDEMIAACEVGCQLCQVWAEKK